MNNFEQNLSKLEKLTLDIKRADISLEDALLDFEQGIQLARGMEKELDKIEGKIQLLMNQPDSSTGETPELGLFSAVDQSGTEGEPVRGTRQ